MQTTQFQEHTIDHTSLASQKSIDKTAAALSSHNFKPLVVDTKEAALEQIKELIPADAPIMNGASETLREIGFLDYLKSGDHPWENLHEAILAEKDPEKQAQLRRTSVVSDYYLGSAHAVTETGEILVASNSGSQLPHLAFTSPNIVLVVGAQKIVPTLAAAFLRLEEHVINLEDKRMMEAYGVGTTHTKTLILHQENPISGRNVHVLIVGESLGF